ncbi:MAG: ABC transporter substrate-binding protein [Candidatus Cloacimonetes bacterium]|nr:ABC transporter substrate-binding protein [Candidatus Cloacimonadota bacterium]
MIKIKYYLFFLCVLLLGLTGCSNKETVFRLAFTSMPETYDKLIRSEYFTNIVNDNIFNQLVTFEANRFEPSLAEYWYNPTDSLFILKLREDIRFSNGKRFTAIDAKASLERALTHPGSFIKNFAKIDSINIVNDFLLNIYHPKCIYIVSLFNNAPMYCADIINQFDDKYLAKNPLGTGEYYLFHEDENKIILKKNKYHPNYKKNKKSPDIVEIYNQPSLVKQYEMLKNNKIDFMFNIPITNYLESVNNKEINIIEKLSSVVMYMMLDVNNQISPEISFNDKSQIINPLSDKRVRQAIVHSINTKAFIEKELNSKAIQLSLPFISYAKGYQVTLPFYKYSLDLAKTLMNEAGFENGFTLRLRAIKNKYSGDTELAEFIKQSLANINIKVEVDYFHSEEFYKSLETNPASAFLTGYTTSSDAITGSVRSLFYLKDEEKGPQNRMNYYIPKLNELYLESLNLYELDSRNEKCFEEMCKIVYDNIYVLPFYQPIDLIALNKKFIKNTKSKNFLFSEFLVK